MTKRMTDEAFEFRVKSGLSVKAEAIRARAREQELESALKDLIEIASKADIWNSDDPGSGHATLMRARALVGL